jgi:hypothetical protein
MLVLFLFWRFCSGFSRSNCHATGCPVLCILFWL